MQNKYNPDVLSCLANLSNDEVFTPPTIANQMLDMLPAELWSNPDAKFLDPCCKSGVFLREIAKRLIDGLAKKIPDLQERLNHIYSKQLYGIAITELTSMLSRRSVYCSKYANGKYSICDEFKNESGNIVFDRTEHTWENGKCKFCGASQAEYDRDEALETHAYQFIHVDEVFKMKFDVIIGNPPYQLSNGCFGAGASPLYHYFVNKAKALNPRYLTMIIPARWYAGGRGLDGFRDEMIHDTSIRVLHDFLDASECFPGVEIKGGVCYFLWDRDNTGKCEIITHDRGTIKSVSNRFLLEPGCETFIRFNDAISILRKVKSKEEETIDSIISSQTPFGLYSNFNDYQERTDSKHNIKLFCRGTTGWIKEQQVLTNNHLVPLHKILVPKAWGNGSSGNTPDVIKPIYAEPNSCCTQTYLVVGAFETEQEAINYKKYLETHFAMFLISLKKNTQDAMRGVYQFVPMQDFNEEWTDEKLYKKYKLTKAEIEFIESMVKPME